MQACVSTSSSRNSWRLRYRRAPSSRQQCARKSEAIRDSLLLDSLPCFGEWIADTGLRVLVAFDLDLELKRRTDHLGRIVIRVFDLLGIVIIIERVRAAMMINHLAILTGLGDVPVLSGKEFQAVSQRCTIHVHLFL